MSRQVGRIGGGVLQDNLKIYQDNAGKDYLNFKNRSADTALLHLDPLTNKISINSESPIRTLTTTTAIRTVNFKTDRIEHPVFTIDNNFTANSGNIYLNAAENIQLSALATDQILIDDEKIYTTESNANLELIPSGTGNVTVYTNLNVYGDTHATGNITFRENLTFGDDSTVDTIAFGQNIKSDIIPDKSNDVSLGSPERRWASGYSNLLNGKAITADEILIGLDSPEFRQGNIFYVSVNGDDSNKGDHPQGPYKTIKRALQAADSSAGGPTTIYVTPGDYEEELPLIIPANTTIKGSGIRATSVRPDTSTQSEDVFLMTGETTVEDLSVTGFYYDSLNDKGYAFRYADGAIVTSRSPYVRNITVITQGTVTTIDDPRGYQSGDAGRGALVDGGAVDAASVGANMLFHSVTFITPGAVGLKMTNGVYVEWLNSFTYYSEIGLHAVRGGVGHLSEDGSTQLFGAELRSIGSACVYGNQGAVADGDGCIMYLIQHNFAYIGTEYNKENDQYYVQHDNEAIELNDGKVYYQSTDEQGKFKVGDAFFVDFETGTTSINADDVNFDGLSQILISGGDDETILNATYVDTGNIRFDSNTVYSTSGDINIDSASTDINFNTDVSMEKDLDITGNFTIDGTLVRFGNAPGDTVKFNTPFSQDFLPDVNSAYTLGNSLDKWKSVWSNQANIDTVQIFNNVITTNDSNANLEFISNGIGSVNFENITFRDRHIGTVDSAVDLDIAPADNLIISAESFVLPRGTNLQRLNNVGDLRYNTQDDIFEGYSGSGNVGFNGVYSSDRETSVLAHPTENHLDFTVNQNKVGEVNLKGIELHGMQINSILIDENIITTNESNADLEIRRNGNGAVYLNEQEYFRNSTWTNADSAGALDLYTTARGYVKINTATKGVSLPYVGTLLAEDTNTVALGTGLAGATVVSSVTGGVTVVDAGTGSGDSGGFGTYGSGTGRHYKFIGSGTRSIVTNTLDLTNFQGMQLSGKVICGDNFNGGEVPDGNENLVLQISDDGTTWTTLEVVAAANNFAAFSIWADFNFQFLELDAGLNLSTIRFRFLQELNSEASGDNYAIADLSLRYAVENSNNPEVGATRYNVGIKQQEVYDGTNWIASTGREEDPVTEEFMNSLVEEWSLILG